MHEKITARILCEMSGIKPDALRVRFTKLHKNNHPEFTERWRIDRELSREQVRELLMAGERKGSEPRAVEPEPDVKGTDTAPPAVNIAMIDAGRPNEVAPNVVPLRRWPLWAALAITAGASVPNMVEVTVAIKGSAPTAYALTAVFTAVPALLIAARLRGFLWGISVAGAMGYTAFCNASAVFGGLTALDKGYILQPTVFLEAVTNMLNTDYLNTARAIAAFTALIIGAVEFVAVKNLSR